MTIAVRIEGYSEGNTGGREYGQQEMKSLEQRETGESGTLRELEEYRSRERIRTPYGKHSKEFGETWRIIGDLKIDFENGRRNNLEDWTRVGADPRRTSDGITRYNVPRVAEGTRRSHLSWFGCGADAFGRKEPTEGLAISIIRLSN